MTWTERAVIAVGVLAVTGLYVGLMLWLEYRQAAAGWMT